MNVRRHPAHALDAPPNVHALGPTHGVDLFFVFGTTSLEIGPSAAEPPLVELVQDLWVGTEMLASALRSLQKATGTGPTMDFL